MPLCQFECPTFVHCLQWHMAYLGAPVIGDLCTKLVITSKVYMALCNSASLDVRLFGHL